MAVLVLITILGSVFIIKNTFTNLSGLPEPTSLDFPNAMNKVNEVDQSHASRSSSKEASPSSHNKIKTK
ncbi:MAG: hypothetical protein M3P33_01010 [bacterium]|nr:hypothetical protein [bacterium]